MAAEWRPASKTAPTSPDAGGSESPGPPNEPSGGSLTRQAGTVILARAFAFVVSFAVPIILVRVIDQVQYGQYRQAIFLLGFFYPILQFGMVQSLFYFYSRLPARQVGLVTQTLVFLLFTGITFAVSMIVARNLVGAYFNDPVMSGYAPVIGPYVGLMVIASILDVLPVVQQKMRLTFGIIVSSESVRAVLLVSVAALTRDVRAMLLALLLFSAIRTGFLLGLLRYQRLLNLREVRTGFLREQLAYSLPFGLAGIVVTLIQMADRLYLSRYVDAAQFGIYSVGCFQLPVIVIVFQSAASVMLGRMAELQGAGRIADMVALLRNAGRKLSLVALPAVAVGLVLARDIIGVIFTEDYLAAVPIFMVFLTLIPRSATAYSTVPRAYGLTRWIFRLTLVALVVAAALVVTLTPVLGLLGPAIAVVVALWVVAGGQIWKSGQLLGTGIRGLYPWGEILRIALLAAILAAALAVVRATVPLPPVVHLLGGGLVYSGAFVLLAIATGLIKRHEVAAARREIARRLGVARS